MYLEKVYDSVDRDAMWWVLEMNSVNGNKNIYADTEVCVRLCRHIHDLGKCMIVLIRMPCGGF